MGGNSRSRTRARARAVVLCALLVLIVAAGAILATGARTVTPTVPQASARSPENRVPAPTDAGTARDARGSARDSAEPSRGASECPSFGFSAPSAWNEPGVDLDRTMAAAVAAGARSVRVGVEWDRIESERGGFDWSGPDRVFAAARTHGLTVVALLHTTPAWARDPELRPSNRHTPPGRIADYVRFAVAAAERYGDRTLAWEVWNEPNIADFWFPRADHGAYAELLRATYPALKAVTPAVPVIAGALAPSPDTPWSYSPEVYLSALYADGIRGSFDALSQHPYPDTSATTPTAAEEDAATWAPVRLSHRIMAEHGDGAKRIWVTEFGAPTGIAERSVSPERQARLMAGALRRAASEEWLGPVYLYTVRDESDRAHHRESNFGVYDHGWRPKPAVPTLAGLVSAPGCGT